MKLCCSSRAYARVLQSGSLTQLEWVDRCAELALDGVDFAAAHFPRTDSDYLAQLKKLCVDRGLTAACVAVDVPFGEGDVDSQSALLGEWIDRAVALGAPLLRLRAGAASGTPAIAWREMIRGLKLSTAAAKDRNVTLAMERHESTLVATPADAKRALKECDSAWLRLAPALACFEPPALADWEPMIGEAVIVVSAGSEDAAVPALARNGYIGFVSVESSGEDEDAAICAAVGRLRAAAPR
jgi:sugar phosphate isomerase/epimerase